MRPIAFIAALQQNCLAIDVASDEVPAEAIAYFQRTFKIHV